MPATTSGHITFGSLNNFCKINPAVLQLWARVLNSVDRSRLLLLCPESSHREHILQTFERDGVTRDRITFVGRCPRPDYLALYHQIDIGLDPFPYNGHTTSLDALWMGVPIVTLVGNTVVGRAGLSQLTNLGLPKLIAHTPEQYINIARNLASDVLQLQNLRSTLRGRMQCSPLMDYSRFARHIEAAYRSVWRRWCA